MSLPLLWSKENKYSCIVDLKTLVLKVTASRTLKEEEGDSGQWWSERGRLGVYNYEYFA